MEVHHHPHFHEGQKWKEYVFQFLMLFMAVFLAFLAENKREHNLESEKESEYIESLMKDTEVDFKTSNDLDVAIFSQIKKIDTLQTLFFSDLENALERDSLIRKCYKLSSSVLTFYPAFFNERTISQLLSSGNMRLIKKQGVADSIMEYHSFIKFVEVQKQLYVNSVNNCIQSMYNVFDISYLKSIMLNDTLFLPDNSMMPIRLLTTAPSELKKFIAVLEITKVVAFTYRGYLTEMNNKASRLYYFLRDKYKFKKV
ncbi:MAG: hypothetical protein JJE22_01520 [Bacteroidia bacterium]|nr:hypothetical protein [Bacteroidia bacterium]